MINSEKIQEIVGRDGVSEHAMAEIIALGPTEEELLEAFTRVTRGDVVGTETQHAPNSTVLKLCEILSADESALPGDPAD